MPIYVKNGKAVLFVHVPKAGGSTIERCFRQAEWEESYFFNPEHVPNELRRVHRCTPQHMHAKLLRDMFRLDQFDLVFLTVRHPMDRICSEYGMRHPDASIYDADAFVAWLETTFERYAKNAFVMDNHIRPQAEFRLAGAHCFKVEQGLDGIVYEVATKLGDAALAYHEVHHVRRANRSFTRIRDDPRVIDHVRRFYATDFEAFGYAL